MVFEMLANNVIVNTTRKKNEMFYLYIENDKFYNLFMWNFLKKNKKYINIKHRYICIS